MTALDSMYEESSAANKVFLIKKFNLKIPENRNTWLYTHQRVE